VKVEYNLKGAKEYLSEGGGLRVAYHFRKEIAYATLVVVLFGTNPTRDEYVSWLKQQSPR